MPTDAYRDALDAALSRIEYLEASRTACIACEQRQRRWTEARRTLSALTCGFLVAVLAAVVIAVTFFALVFITLWPAVGTT